MPVVVDVKRWDLETTKKGTKLVTRGEYVGTTTSREYPDSKIHQFVQIDDEGRGGLRVPLAGGALDWSEEQGDLIQGQCYDVTWGGKEAIAKGKFAGKLSNRYNLARYEEDEMPAKWLAKKEAKNPSAPLDMGMHTGAAPAAQVEALDDLS